MKSIKSTLLAATMGIVGFASITISANDNEEKEVRVEIRKSNDENAKVDINVNGNAEVFSLPSLELGETKDIVTESGNTISVTKTDSGVSVSINGEEIDLPSVGAEMSAHFMKGGMPLHHAKSDGIQVIGDLTDEQIAIIKDGFAAAGVEKKINFTKGHEMKFFFSGDDAKNFDVQFHDSNVNTWTSENGEHVKIIKLHDGEGEGEVKIKTKVLVIEKEDN